MGFWNSFFGKPLKINNSFFGELVFMEVKADPANNYFEGWRYFKPSNDEIEIGINGNLEGPEESQRDFFRRIENNYKLVIQRIAPFVENAFQERQLDFKVDDFKQEFKPVYLFIPNCIQKPIRWEIAFESKPEFISHNYPYILTIEMVDFEPQYVSASQ